MSNEIYDNDLDEYSSMKFHNTIKKLRAIFSTKYDYNASLIEEIIDDITIKYSYHHGSLSLDFLHISIYDLIDDNDGIDELYSLFSEKIENYMSEWYWTFYE